MTHPTIRIQRLPHGVGVVLALCALMACSEPESPLTDCQRKYRYIYTMIHECRYELIHRTDDVKIFVCDTPLREPVARLEALCAEEMFPQLPQTQRGEGGFGSMGV